MEASIAGMWLELLEEISPRRTSRLRPRKLLFMHGDKRATPDGGYRRTDALRRPAP
jgi:hypothetical protein